MSIPPEPELQDTTGCEEYRALSRRQFVGGAGTAFAAAALHPALEARTAAAGGVQPLYGIACGIQRACMLVDRDATHRGRALLGHVVLGTVVLLAEDGLALATAAEEVDQVAGAEERAEHRGRTGDHDGDHWEPRSRSATTARSSNSMTVEPMVCVVS